MTSERFIYLLGLYRSGEISPDQWDQLRTAIGEGRYDDLLQKEMLRTIQEAATDTPAITDTPATPHYPAITNEQTIADEPTMADDPIMTRTNSPRRPPFRRIFAYAAVAALLIGIITGWWWLRTHAGTEKNGDTRFAIARHKMEEVRPGSDKAILILADGSRITLDSSHNGQIAQTGNTRIFSFKGHLTMDQGQSRLTMDHGQGHSAMDQGKREPLTMDAYHTILTPRGGQYEIELPDGSKVWLNSASSLRFPSSFTGTQRNVELTGEGYFEIAGNPRMPFIVNVKTLTGEEQTVRVLGTQFNIMAYPEEQRIRTTLLQGGVQISRKEMTATLTPGKQAVFDSAHLHFKLTQVDTRQVVAWKNGLFEFDHTDLTTIMRQLARWYDIEVIYRTSPDKTPLGGSISRNLQLPEVLALLEAQGINHFKIEGRKVLVLP